jgi:hypothetical protein
LVLRGAVRRLARNGYRLSLRVLAFARTTKM